MSGRRGFLALVGGAAVSGLVTTRASATRSTLIMPPALVIDPPTMPAGAYPLLAGYRSQMHAFIEIKKLIPDDYFLDWLEGGLRTARMFKGRDEATLERLFAERGDRPLCEGDWP